MQVGIDTVIPKFIFHTRHSSKLKTTEVTSAICVSDMVLSHHII